ncbi:uncharacterized protein N7477_010075 [Penicillium maclennaniae]|uniref:uncharacterized protein n=1 Tax=Penicillium maclennaniae TaxID=1343394 RepID=UPI002541707D|nr:uncharacterized protein N7477_010075 [Penicillium maclennaniae]KAJ5662459.1 hypothetical protein N7477_010075 [Penicillium maclennaniae]
MDRYGSRPRQEIKMLEYACGPGVISMTLAPFLTQVVGIDVSDKMVEEFNKNANVVDMSSRMTGYKADLLSEPAPQEFAGPEFSNFDVITISMALHHFEHADTALQKLAKRLKHGGACFIIDLVPHIEKWGHGHDHSHGHSHDHADSHEHSHGHGPSHEQMIQREFGDAAHTVKTHGFSKDEMQKLFQDAGLSVKFDYKVLPEPLIFTKAGKTVEKTVFIARAQLA